MRISEKHDLQRSILRVLISDLQLRIIAFEQDEIVDEILAKGQKAENVGQGFQGGPLEFLLV